MEEAGAGGGSRTPDPIITNDVLYQLSYAGKRPVWARSILAAGVLDNLQGDIPPRLADADLPLPGAVCIMARLVYLKPVIDFEQI